MSAFLTARMEEQIIILSDGASYRGLDDFAVTGMMSKTLVLPHLTCAMVVRGTANMLLQLNMNHRSTWASFDELVTILPEQADTECDRFHQFYPDRHGIAELAVCGWSESRERFESYSFHMDSWEECRDKLEPTPAIYMAPIPDRDRVEANGVPVEGTIRLEGLHRLMQAQRETPHFIGLPGDSADACEKGYCVGMFIEEVTVTHSGILSRIVKRWPDKIGEMIDPFADADKQP
ncbi:hypothetical protein [Chelativorans alearense]|uniref:hypothetical protein n=1 Tax=Chelativorans alearense TaxID=2681495 RepID=UPI0013D3B6E6|nr:hypothetical protein [Chelativorans alearense]